MHDVTTCAAEPARLEFDGSLGGYLGIAVVNVLLTIVTLGIYRFWGKTRVRRYLWSRTSFLGERLEYSGKGLHLFVGALIAFVAVLLPFALTSQLLTTLIMQGQFLLTGIAYVALITALLFLVGIGLYRAQRYLLGHTLWRGVHGGMANNGVAYGWLMLKLSLLQMVTLGFATPYVSTRLWTARWNDARYGSLAFTAQADWRPLFKRFVVSLLATFMVYALALAAIGQMVGLDQLNDPTQPRAIWTLLGVYLVAALAAGLIMLNYMAAYWRHVVGGLRLGDVAFGFDATASQWLRYYLGNGAILLLTLGLGIVMLPWRAYRFMTANLSFEGEIDAAALEQSQLQPDQQGEGIADAFDLGAF